MTIDWNEYLSEEAKLRQPSCMIIPRDPSFVSLAAGLPNPEFFPLKGISLDVESPETNFRETSKISYDYSDNKSEIIESCQYTSSKGFSNFQDWSKNYINKFFRPNYKDWDSLIQCGGTYSLDSIFRILMNPGIDTALCEELTYSCFLETCIPLRTKVFSVKMDENGFSPKDMENKLDNWYENEETKHFKKPKIFYCMPVGHNPAGITMSIERRKKLIEICLKHKVIIVEDDPYYHLQLEKESEEEEIPSLLKFDTEGIVIRIDSFSKMLMPGLRTSIVTGNKFFLNKMCIFNELSIHSASANSQLTLCMIFNLWKEEGFDKWLVNLQTKYRLRRDVMLDSFDKYLPSDLVTWNRPKFGMFIWINIKLEKFPKQGESKADFEWAEFIENEIFKESVKNKVVLAKGHWFMANKSSELAGFRATYSYATEAEIIIAAENFGKAIRSVYSRLHN